ncbi:MAG: OsmC family protein [Schleiferiaceae bacterium]|nr:OsmC family protein [Schleiferiaceae bacterium]
MSTSKLVYREGLRTEAIHLNSQQSIITDAPIDNHGLGQAFSPTDLVATSLASCMLTVMGIKARDMGYPLQDTYAEVEKVMASGPRRISAIYIQIHFSSNADEKTRTILEATALHCPVAKSLHPEIEQSVQFYWPAV